MKMEVISGNQQEFHGSTKSRFFLGEGDLDSNGLNFGNVGIFTALFVDSVEKKESEVT